MLAMKAASRTKYSIGVFGSAALSIFSIMGMMFLGSEFCGHCGAKAYKAKLLDDEKPGDCPRCKVALQSLKIGTVQIRECERCGGFWSGIPAFEELCASKEKQASVIGFIGSYSHADSAPSAVSYVPCPDCKQLMNRSNFARSSGVIIDLCKQHVSTREDRKSEVALCSMARDVEARNNAVGRQ